MLLVKQALTIKGHWTQCSLWLMPFLCGAANARDTQCGVGAEYERKGYEGKGYAYTGCRRTEIGFRLEEKV